MLATMVAWQAAPHAPESINWWTWWTGAPESLSLTHLIFMWHARRRKRHHTAIGNTPISSRKWTEPGVALEQVFALPQFTGVSQYTSWVLFYGEAIGMSEVNNNDVILSQAAVAGMLRQEEARLSLPPWCRNRLNMALSLHTFRCHSHILSWNILSWVFR